MPLDSIYDKFKSTLHLTSKDDSNDEYLSNSSLPVYNFDDIRTNYIESFSLERIPMSADAFVKINASEMYLVEFKNGAISNREIFEIRKKMYDSLLLLCDLLGIGISQTRQSLQFILVTNERKRNDLAKRKVTSEKGNEHKTGYGLDDFVDIYYKDVHTVTAHDFQKQFVSNWETP